MQNLFTKASSLILSNVTLETLDDLDDVEVLPSHIPDLSSEGPLTVSGRFRGSFPDTFKVKGLTSDMSTVVIDLKLHDAKDIPLDRVLAKGQIEILTAQAWLSEDKQLEEKVGKLSAQTGVVSEYTRMVILGKESAGQLEASKKSQDKKKESDNQRMINILPLSFGVGFGNLVATADNIPPGSEEPRLPEAAEIFVKAASSCCGSLCNHCCCMRCIQCCSAINPQFATLLTQIFTGLACASCLGCCAEMCCGRGSGGS